VTTALDDMHHVFLALKYLLNYHHPRSPRERPTGSQHVVVERR
jgi:hypothetical protein